MVLIILNPYEQMNQKIKGAKAIKRLPLLLLKNESMRRKSFSSGKKERGEGNSEKPKDSRGAGRKTNSRPDKKGTFSRGGYKTRDNRDGEGFERRGSNYSGRKTAGEKPASRPDKRGTNGRGGYKTRENQSEEGFERKNTTPRGRKTAYEKPSFDGRAKRTDRRSSSRTPIEKHNRNYKSSRADESETGGSRKRTYKSGGERYSQDRNDRYDKPSSNRGRKGPEGEQNKPGFEEKRRNSRNTTESRFSDKKERHADSRGERREGGKPEGRFNKSRSSEARRGFAKERKEDLGEERTGSGESKYRKPRGDSFRKPSRTTHKKTEKREQDSGDGMRLNKFIANSGISSRRDADKFIKTGVVTVNGKVVTEMGYRVAEGDIVKFGDRSIRPEKPVYVVLNKPKDFITTTDDPRGRNIVTNLIKIKERIFPIGRLDRNTTGVLIFTNDGDLGERLMHPRFNITKIYLAVLDKNLKPEHMQQLKEGVELEDGIIAFDDIAYVADDKKTIGVQIHSGRNRIIHRSFEHLGYKVDKLDRTSYAGITKKDLKRGDWRYLTPLELIELKKLTKLKGKY